MLIGGSQSQSTVSRTFWLITTPISGEEMFSPDHESPSRPQYDSNAVCTEADEPNCVFLSSLGLIVDNKTIRRNHGDGTPK